jgi:hypothetical protein
MRHLGLGNGIPGPNPPSRTVASRLCDPNEMGVCCGGSASEQDRVLFFTGKELKRVGEFQTVLSYENNDTCPNPVFPQAFSDVQTLDLSSCKSSDCAAIPWTRKQSGTLKKRKTPLKGQIRWSGGMTVLVSTPPGIAQLNSSHNINGWRLFTKDGSSGPGYHLQAISDPGASCDGAPEYKDATALAFKLDQLMPGDRVIVVTAKSSKACGKAFKAVDFPRDVKKDLFGIMARRHLDYHIAGKEGGEDAD